MEHVVQFGVSIDDGAIEREVVRLATGQIIRQIADEVRSQLGVGGSRYSPSEFARKVADSVMEDCRDDIVERVAELVAEKAPKTRWYREAVREAVAARLEAGLPVEDSDGEDPEVVI